MSLKHVLTILEEINSNLSRLEKEKIIKKNEDDKIFKKVVYYALNPYYQYNTKRINFIETLSEEFIIHFGLNLVSLFLKLDFGFLMLKNQPLLIIEK